MSAGRTCLPRGGHAVPRWGDIGCAGCGRWRRRGVQAQQRALCGGKGDIGEVILWSIKRVQGQEDVEEEEDLEEHQRKFAVDGIVLEKATCAVEELVSTQPARLT